MSQTIKKMPAPPKADWKKSLGSFDAFHKAAEISVGRKLRRFTMKLSAVSQNPTHSAKPSKVR